MSERKSFELKALPLLLGLGAAGCEPIKDASPHEDTGIERMSNCSGADVEGADQALQVDDLVDSVDGICEGIACSTLRAAVEEGTAVEKKTTHVCVPEGTVEIAHGEMLIGGHTFNNDLKLIIEGQGETPTVLDLGGASRAFLVEDDTALTLRNITIQNGFEDQGGAVFNEGTLVLDTATLADNEADQGGAIYSDGFSASLQVQNSNFERNAADQGGAINVVKGELVATGTNFSGNDAKEGGALSLDFLANGDLSGNKFNANTANTGGALYVGGEVKSSEDEFTGNTAREGGAIALEGTLTVEGSEFTANQATLGAGGAINSSGEITIEDAQFDSNVAKTNGGALALGSFYNPTINNSTFSGNTAEGDGGAIQAEAEIAVEGGEFSSNSAGGNGGAINTCDTYEPISITGVDFDGNSAKNGGALCLGDYSDIAESTLSGNSASENGGGIHFEGAFFDEDNLNITDTLFSENQAEDNGGGLYADSASGTVERNAWLNNTAGNQGGGLYNDSYEGSLKIVNNTMYGNEAEKGGAVSNVDGKVTIDASTLAENEGAAIFSGEDAITVVKGDIFHGNNYEGESTVSLGRILSEGDNINDGDSASLSASTDLNETDAKLDPTGPADHGGFTPTVALEEGSPAIDGRSDSERIDGEELTEDQRGFARPGGEKNDVGSHEEEATE